MRKIFCLTFSVLLIFSAVHALASTSNDFISMQALSLYSASQLGNGILLSDENVDIVDKTVSVSFSSDALFENLSDITIVAYMPTEDEGAPSLNNIYYLDQRTYNDNSISFSLPSNAPTGKYVILMGASDLSVVARADFSVCELGDLNRDFVFNTLDIIKLKKCISSGETVLNSFKGGDTYLADYNKDGIVDVLDINAMKAAIASKLY